MPDTASLKARFGADVMAAEIEKAYFAALGRQPLGDRSKATCCFKAFLALFCYSHDASSREVQ